MEGVFLKRQKVVHISLLAVASIAAVSSFLYFHLETQKANELPELTQDTKEAFRSYWIETIREHGGERAYGSFHRIYGDAKNPIEIHREAHVFGGALYRVEGLRGISVCDHNYAYGCYHEFLSQALVERGLEGLDILYEACLDTMENGGSPTTCRHGIGHGILSYIGYEEEDLVEALSYCSRLPYNDPIGGCYGGIFMEYNLRTILSVDGVPVREHEGGETLLEPCASLSERFQEACYYQQTMWWVSVIEGENEEVYAQMGSLCDGSPDPVARRACFEGVGKVAVNVTTDDRSEIVDLCRAASSDTESDLYCRSVAANIYHLSYGETPDSTAELCGGFEGRSYEYCVAHSVNECLPLQDEHHWHYCQVTGAK